MHFRGLDIRAGLSFRVCAGLFIGLVCATFAAALPLPDNDMPNPASSVHLTARNGLKRLPMMLQFIFPPNDPNLLLSEPLSTEETVKQIQAYLERMQIGFGFVPTIDEEDMMASPSRHVPSKTVYFELKLKDSTEESKQFWGKWGSWHKASVKIASPFSPTNALIYQNRAGSILLEGNTLRIPGEPSVILPPATVHPDLH
ncbi:hypothetical protein F5050DRAFT_1707689 [Lentinula boryana]|uniref:Uncharacterized protein n=1 Tax=Lentinula boryana TaxID=40481 RepID=A0ABQ8QV76_9AGAR|nr:hypothetical protein F5050DRAFT_1707689 [Lentinula boryana]